MSGWADELDSSYTLAVDALKKLEAIDPSNQLLFYMKKPAEGQIDPFNGDEQACKKAFKDRFWNGEKPWDKEAGVIVTTVCYSNYYFALKDETSRLLVNKERER